MGHEGNGMAEIGLTAVIAEWNANMSLYYSPHTNTLRLFWRYFGDVVHLPDYNFGPYYYVGTL